jgi:hypothetical protein
MCAVHVGTVGMHGASPSPTQTVRCHGLRSGSQATGPRACFARVQYLRSYLRTARCTHIPRSSPPLEHSTHPASSHPLTNNARSRRRGARSLWRPRVPLDPLPGGGCWLAVSVVLQLLQPPDPSGLPAGAGVRGPVADVAPQRRHERLQRLPVQHGGNARRCHSRPGALRPTAGGCGSCCIVAAVLLLPPRPPLLLLQQLLRCSAPGGT